MYIFFQTNYNSNTKKNFMLCSFFSYVLLFCLNMLIFILSRKT